VAAGRFYPGDDRDLRRTVEELLEKEKGAVGMAVVSPHAGYEYSGGLAARSLKAVGEFDTYVLIGPNHTGMGKEVAVSAEPWRTPLGDVPVDDEVVASIDLPVDETAHGREHSLEVQVPFLQVLHDDFSIVPIAMKDQSTDAAKKVLDELDPFLEDIGLVASSDLTHYAALGEAGETDERFLERVLDLDVEGVQREAARTSVCGYGPITAAILLAQRVGLEAELLGYSTSAEATGDASNVVGYGSVLFS